jgi:hypothetical protein
VEIMKQLQSLAPFISEETLGKVQSTWTKGGLLDAGWTNIIDHQCAAAAMGAALCGQVGDRHTINDVVTACLVHDAFKRREIEATRAAQGDPRVLDAMAAEQNQFLTDLGWPTIIVSATASVGHTSLERFYRNPTSVTVRERMVHLADALTEGDQFPTLEVRMANLRQRYPTLQATDPTYYGLPAGRTVFGVGEQIAFSLLAEFGDRTGLQPRRFHEECIRGANSILMR